MATIHTKALEAKRLRARVEELEGALKALAETHIQPTTADAIHSAIIVASGNGPFADHIVDLLTARADEARALTEKETDNDGQ